MRDLQFNTYKVIFYIVLLLLSIGCTETQIVESYNSNIHDLNKFSEINSVEEEYDIPYQENTKALCLQASIYVKDIPLYVLSDMMTRLYNTHVNSVNNLDDKNFNVSINVKDICFNDLLEYLTEEHNIGYIKTPYGYNLYSPQLKTKIFSVDYHNFYRNASSVMSISNSQLNKGNNSTGNNGGGNFSAIESTYKEHFWDNIERTLKMIILNNSSQQDPLSGASDNQSSDLNTPNATKDSGDKTGHIAIYRESGLVLVKAYPRELRNVEKFLHQINKHSLRQIVIEAKILEIELLDQFSNGIQWELLKKKLYVSSFVTPDANKQTAAALYQGTTLSSDNLVSTIISSKLTNHTDFSAILQALSSQGKISVLSSPRVSALNNQRALIKFGDDRFFVTNVTNISVGSNNSNNSGTQSGFDLEPFFSGIALDATPNIVNDREVVLHIHPMITRVEDEVKRIKIDDKDTSIPIAKIQTREADTVVKAFSGDIIILGGMMQNFVNLNRSGPPGLEKGLLSKIFAPFFAKEHINKRSELIILLKPTIITAPKYDRNINFDNYLVP